MLRTNSGLLGNIVDRQYSKLITEGFGKEGLEMLDLKNWICVISVLGVLACPVFGAIADFEDLALEPDSFWNGDDSSGGFSSGSAYFENYYDTVYGMWGGVAYSNKTDTLAEGWGAQYNAITGSGQGGSANYAIAYQDSFNNVKPTFNLNEPALVNSIWVTNNNYAYYIILNGDPVFGTEPFSDGDWFKLTITGKDADAQVVGIMDFYLADYRDGKTDIVNTWEQIDLSSLGLVTTVEFELSSSDTGEWGMNTPAYFALDTIIPEPATIILIGFGGLIFCKRQRKSFDG